MLNTIITIIDAYLLGSIPSAYIASCLRKETDIRHVGIKNMDILYVYCEVVLKEAVLLLPSSHKLLRAFFLRATNGCGHKPYPQIPENVYQT